ncbi:MAG: 16S rRNA processing protein RimM [Chryseobacterium sp.]|nr:MAG: 16S rRNA processing protein RimM [Chryseobacterium sp.]
MRKEDCYLLGRIVRRHGLAGNVILKLDTDKPEDYKKLESVFVDVNGLLVPFFIDKRSWSRSDSMIVGFKNTTEAQIDQLLGKEVFLPLSSLPPLTGTQFYYHEVIGFSVLGTDGSNYGIIESVNDQTAQHYFILDRSGKQVIVPIVRDWINEVDRAGKTITMDLPEGLLDVYLSSSERDE